MKNYLEFTRDDISYFDYLKYVVDALVSEEQGFEIDLAYDLVSNYPGVLEGAYDDKCTVEAGSEIISTLFDL